ncbi:unnamed protein product [Vitrella brassicaformis CCMP3155]|uniref:Charged multivesicular body protein 5 n=1 Tax=Vitrella brassicaformis (strain CCMP3155) TaxID=1169540 RepID=A0A0G4FPR3_VITBC|nr:unnamed protein product [Vitrella brassicaformis CCMP3155]|eukprot:CEM16447.1 unnamed protein product [Vitrella brassicaformis CCMP3155]
MKRFFGTSSKAPAKPAPSLAEASGHIDGRVTHIEAQIKKCDDELARYKQQLASVRGPAQAGIKQQALTVLKRKKMYEQQRDQLQGTQFNVDQAAFATEQLETTAMTVDAMKAANVNLKQQFKKMDIDEIERVQEDMADLMLDQEEINDILSRNYALPQDIDEGELEAEFAALQDDVALDDATAAADSVPSYLPANLPGVPSNPIGEHATPEQQVGLQQNA